MSLFKNVTWNFIILNFSEKFICCFWIFCYIFFFLSQRKVCCRKEMHPQWDRGRSGRQIYPQAAEREIMPGGDPEGGGDARAWTRAPETGRSQGGVRDTQWARTHNWVVSVNANSNLSRFLNLNYLYINLHYCTNLVTRANYNLICSLPSSIFSCLINLTKNLQMQMHIIELALQYITTMQTYDS